MPQCGGKTTKGIRCKIVCKNKFCKYHCKQSGGYKSPMKQQYLKPFKCGKKSCPVGCVSKCVGRRGGSTGRLGKQRRTTPRLHYAPIVPGIPENKAQRGWGKKQKK